MARQVAQGAHTGALVGATVEFKVHFGNGERGRRRLRTGAAPKPKALEPGRIPRVSRLMALAIHFDCMIRKGVVQDYADLARLGGVCRARISQIMDLLNLAPAIQEELLFLPRNYGGRDSVTERRIRRIAAGSMWRAQGELWRKIRNDLKRGEKL